MIGSQAAPGPMLHNSDTSPPTNASPLAYGSLLGEADAAAVVLDARGRIVYANPSASDLLSSPAGAVIEQRCGEALVPNERIDLAVEGTRIIELTTFGIAPGLTLGFLRDVTEARVGRDARLTDEDRLRATFEQSGVGTAIVPPALGSPLTEVNQALCDMVGCSAADLAALRLDDLLAEDEVERVRGGLRKLLDGEIARLELEVRAMPADGRELWVCLTATLVNDGTDAPIAFAVQMQDHTDRRRTERELRVLADHDPLTGSYNRRRFEEELRRELAAANRYGPAGALLILDLDNFKVVNDTRGHARGDEMLRTVAKLIRERLRDSDVVGRLGGDEFGIILPHADAHAALAVAHDIGEAISRHCDRARHGRTSASVGIAPFCAGAEGRSAERLLAEADAAMYSAKDAGRHCARLFDGKSVRLLPDLPPAAAPGGRLDRPPTPIAS